MKRTFALIIAVFALIFSIPSATSARSNEKLLKMVALSRHGVRAPTQTEKQLTLWTRKPWPAWPVERGDLTPRGAELIKAMWKHMHGLLQKDGLLPENICPPNDLIHVRADTEERTQATAAALLEGLAPGCNMKYSVADVSPDPLFHPIRAGIYKFDPIPTVTNILSMTDGGLNALQDDFMGALQLLNRIAGPPAAGLCIRYAENADCSIADLPNAISVSSDGKNVKLLGSLSMASSMAELFLLEYAEWPKSPAGWGQVNTSTLSQLLPVHSKIMDVVNRAPLVARARGSSLLHEMGLALLNKHADKKLNDAKLVIFVGHDTNIANLGGLLGANWQAKSFPANGIPPGSLLAMELWDNMGKQEVRLRFYAQTLEALHSEIAEDGTDWNIFAPSRNPVSVPPVVGEARFTPAEFDSLIRTAIKGAPLAPAEKTHEVEGMPSLSK